MKIKLSNQAKILIVIICFICSFTGFIVKLPSAFRHVDKELHFAFYFLAATFLNILFNVKNVFVHILIFVSLYIFGVFIEYSQEYYNVVFHSRIHGRYDPQDVKANLKGLLAFSVLWLLAFTFNFIKSGIKKLSYKTNN